MTEPDDFEAELERREQERARGWTLATFGLAERDVWLVHLVSPRLQHEALASQLGFSCMGFLPPELVDHPKRLVLVWVPTAHSSRDDAIESLEESKWVAGFKEEHWTEEGYPFGTTGSRILYPDAVTAEDYGHSTNLPPWPEKA